MFNEKIIRDITIKKFEEGIFLSFSNYKDSFSIFNKGVFIKSITGFNNLINYLNSL